MAPLYAGLASSVAAGYMSATDKMKLDNVWIDVTANTIANLVGDDSTLNDTNFATLYAALPVNGTLYFPPGTYRFAAELNLNRNVQARFLGAGRSRSLLKTTSATANLLHLSIDAFYNTFEELGFRASVAKTAGAYILMDHNNDYCDVRRCEFQGGFNDISFSGATAGNVTTVSECQFNTPSANGSRIVINGVNINIVIQASTINCGTVAGTVGMLINQSGAVQLVGNDFIGGVSCLLINATATVAAVFSTNCFYDQSTLGSTVKIMGASSTSRVKFTCCGITCGTAGAPGVTAFEIAGSGTGTSIPDGIDLDDCDLYNNGGAGTTTGILATGWRGLGVRNCRISGFTNGIDLTPYNANGVSKFQIVDNVIGPTENFSGNTTGIQVRAGAVQYGSSILAQNDLSGNTTAPWVYAPTLANTGIIVVRDNIGLVCAPANSAPGQLYSTTAITKVSSPSFYLPKNAPRPGTKVKFRVLVTCAATINTAPGFVPALRIGVNDTSADTAIVGTPAYSSAGTAALGTALYEWEIVFLSATTAQGSLRIQNLNNAATGVLSTAAPFALWLAISTSTFTIPTTTADNWIGAYFTSTVANIDTIRSVEYEVTQ